MKKKTILGYTCSITFCKLLAIRAPKNLKNVFLNECFKIQFCIHPSSSSKKVQITVPHCKLIRQLFLFYCRCAIPHVLQPGPVPPGAVPPAPLPRLLPGRTHCLLHPSIPAILYSAHSLTVLGLPAKRMAVLYTDKKENQTFLKYKEIQNGAVAKSYMTNGRLIYGEIFAHFIIY